MKKYKCLGNKTVLEAGISDHDICIDTESGILSWNIAGMPYRGVDPKKPNSHPNNGFNLDEDLKQNMERIKLLAEVLAEAAQDSPRPIKTIMLQEVPPPGLRFATPDPKHPKDPSKTVTVDHPAHEIFFERLAKLLPNFDINQKIFRQTGTENFGQCIIVPKGMILRDRTEHYEPLDPEKRPFLQTLHKRLLIAAVYDPKDPRNKLGGNPTERPRIFYPIQRLVNVHLKYEPEEFNPTEHSNTTMLIKTLLERGFIFGGDWNRNVGGLDQVSGVRNNTAHSHYESGSSIAFLAPLALDHKTSADKQASAQQPSLKTSAPSSSSQSSSSNQPSTANPDSSTVRRPTPVMVDGIFKSSRPTLPDQYPIISTTLLFSKLVECINDPNFIKFYNCYIAYHQDGFRRKSGVTPEEQKILTDSMAKVQAKLDSQKKQWISDEDYKLLMDFAFRHPPFDKTTHRSHEAIAKDQRVWEKDFVPHLPPELRWLIRKLELRFNSYEPQYSEQLPWEKYVMEHISSLLKPLSLHPNQTSTPDVGTGSGVPKAKR